MKEYYKQRCINYYLRLKRKYNETILDKMSKNELSKLSGELQKEYQKYKIEESKKWIPVKYERFGFLDGHKDICVEYHHIDGKRIKELNCWGSEIVGGTCQCINHNPYKIRNKT
jgi:hypothetical protein